MTEIEKRSDKNTCRAEAILSGVVSDLIKEGLKDYTVLSKATQEDVGTFILLVQNAKVVIKDIQRSAFNLRNARLLTGFCALVFPGVYDTGASIRHFSRRFGIHRQAKYMRIGLANKRAFNQFLKQKGGACCSRASILCRQR